MNDPAPRSYDNWRADHHAWDDIAHFHQGFTGTQPGVHSIGLGLRETLDVLVVGSPGSDGRAVPVFLNGAVPSRDTKAGPFFSGARVGPQVAPGHIAISDPSVDRDPGVSLAWYAGNEFADVPTALLDLLRILGTTLDSELVLVGGSGGGFASLLYAGRSDVLVSAFVWNPQTDVLAYNRTFVESYLHAAYPSSFPEISPDDSWKHRAARACADAGIRHSVVDEAHTPSSLHRMLLLQNRPDWHMSSHTVPYMEQHRFRSLGTGSYLLDVQHVVQVAEWGSGHAPLPQDLIVDHLRRFLDGDSSALDVGRAVATGPQCQPDSLSRAPMDLRPLQDVVAASVDASPIQADGRFHVTTGHVPIGYGGLRFEVAQHRGTERRQLAWPSEGPELVVPPRDLDSSMTPTLIVRDGFNHHLANIPLHVVPELSTPVEDTAPRLAPAGESTEQSALPADGVSEAGTQGTAAVGPVFVYGSCVTRDAFALPGAPPIAEYVARSPLVSAMGEILPEPPTGTDLSDVASAFQQRMVRWDWEKALSALLRDVPHDLLVLDFIDERIPLVRTDAGIVAYSLEAQRAGLTVTAPRRLDYTTDGYADMWKAAADRLLERISTQRLILNRAFWASVDEHGDDLTARFPVEVHNRQLTWMYDYIASTTNCRVIDYPEHLLVAKSDHHWGLSPFHYIDNFYEHFLQELKRIHRDG